MLVIKCQFPQNPTCSLLPNTCCVHGIELCNLSIFMKSGKIQNPFGPHLLALLSPLPCSRFRIWISGCQTLQCPLTPRLSHPLSCLFPSCPEFSTPFSFPKILPVLRMWPLDSFHTFSHHPLPFTGHLTCSSLILQLLYVFTHACVMSLDTRCVKSVLKSSMFFSTAPVIDVVLVVMTSMQTWTLSCWNLIYWAISICPTLLLTLLMAQLLYRVGMHDINRTDRISADMGKITLIFFCPIKDLNRLLCLIHLWNRKIVRMPGSTKTGQVAWVMFSIALLFSILAGGGLLLLFNDQTEPRFYLDLILFAKCILSLFIVPKGLYSITHGRIE